MAKPTPHDVQPIDYDNTRQPITFKRLWRTWLVLGICMAGVALISHFMLAGQSIRLDESQSLWQSSHTLGGILRVVATDVHLPTYILLLHFWIQYFGDSVTTVRLLSLLFMLANIPVVYMLARQVLKSNWALFATVLYSFSPFINWYTNETREYTLLALAATVSQYYFLRLLQRRRVWFRYGLSAVIGAYVHYFFSFNLLFEGLFFLFNRKKFAPGSFKRFVIAGVITLLSLVPWLIYFHNLGSGQNLAPNLPRPSSVDFFNVFSQFLFGFQNDHINTILVALWPLLMLVAFFAVRKEQAASPQIGFIATMAFGPVVLAFVASYLLSPFFISRYLISSLAPLIILVVWLISYYGRKFAIIAAAGLLLLTIPTSYQQAFSTSTPVREDYRSAAQLISERADANDVVVLSTPFTVYPFEYYYHGTASVQTLPIWSRENAGSIPPFKAAQLPNEATSLSQGHRYVYLLLSYNQGYEEQIRQYYLHHDPKLYSVHFSPDLTLYVFKVGYDVVPPLGSPKTQLNAQQAATSQPNYTIF